MTNSRKTNVTNNRLKHLVAELARRANSETAVERALTSADLSRVDLETDGHMIESQKEARFLQAAVTILEDTSFAASAGLSFGNNTGIGAYVAKYSQDLRAALENARQYTNLTEENFRYQLHSSSNSASIVILSRTPLLELGDRVREFVVFLILAVFRSVTHRDFYPLEIRFEHSAPNAKSSIVRLAGCTVIFDAEETEIILAPSTLRLPIPTYDPTLLGYLKNYGDSLLAQLDKPQPDLRAQIEALLVDSLPGRILPAAEVAASLGMGHRTLTRRLADAGLSFSSIVNELRGSLAKTYLSQSKTPISEIAFLLDYSDQAAFTTAFKRWTGATPKAFRAEGDAR